MVVFTWCPPNDCGLVTGPRLPVPGGQGIDTVGVAVEPDPVAAGRPGEALDGRHHVWDLGFAALVVVTRLLGHPHQPAVDGPVSDHARYGTEPLADLLR